MFELRVRREFCAAHSLSIAGEIEPTHGHNWTVTAVFGGPTLDDDGLLYDFHELEGHLDAIIAPFHNDNFNETPPFDQRNPSAERIAQYIAEQLQQRVSQSIDVLSVSITEAPGCEATFRPM